MDSSVIGMEWEDACGHQRRTVGAPANRAKHDLVSYLELNNACIWLLKKGLGALPSSLPVLNHGGSFWSEWLKPLP